MSDPAGYGQIQPNDSVGDYNRIAALVAQKLSRVRTIMWGKVVAVTAAPEPNAPILVQVQPLVGMTDGIGNSFPLGLISAVPAMRLMSGLGAVICDPVKGDMGFLFICDRDSSSAKANLALSAPPTARMFDLSDSLFFGGWGNTAPASYVKFRPDGGIELADKFGNTMITNMAGANFTNLTGTFVLSVNGTPVTVP